VAFDSTLSPPSYYFLSSRYAFVFMSLFITNHAFVFTSLKPNKFVVSLHHERFLSLFIAILFQKSLKKERNWLAVCS